jgi:hypothetical protein
MMSFGDEASIKMIMIAQRDVRACPQYEMSLMQGYSTFEGALRSFIFASRQKYEMA